MNYSERTTVRSPHLTGISQIYCRAEKAIKKDNSLDRIIRRLERKIMWNVET